MIYKSVQTGPKIQFGGVKVGLFKSIYQVGMAEKVNIEPIKPAISEIDIKNTRYMFFGNFTI